MKAKDTVMDDKERLNLFDEAGSKGIALSEQGDILLKAQAEISFKVGKTLGVAESLKPALKAIEDSRKAGIREVVEWLQLHPYYKRMFKESPFEWQAKLKEWGIDEENQQ